MESSRPIGVRTRSDITLELIDAVAWRGASLEIAPEALAVMDRCQRSFEAFVSDRVKGSSGIYVLPADGPGEAREVTRHQHAIGRQ